MNEMEAFNPQLTRVQQRSMIIGGAALVLCVIGAFRNAEHFFQSYLYAYVFWISIPLGCFAILMLHHMVGGGWGFVIRRLLEAGTRTIPLMVVLFVPLLFGLHSLYEWTHTDVVARDGLLQHKTPYLNTTFFWARAFIYFALWLMGAYFLNKWSFEQDRTGDPYLIRKLQVLSGPGLVLWGATVTFASIDWVMSLEPHWYSTIYGMFFMVGQGLTSLAFVIVVLTMLADRSPLKEVANRQIYHDLGNLMLAFVMLWAYIALSQFLIIWSGNLPEEIPWYLHRMAGGWKEVAAILMVFHFALPFFLLLLRATKRNFKILSRVAAAMLVMRLIDVFWMVKPAFYPKSLHVSWMDMAALIGIGGLWIGFFVWKLKDRPLLPLHDPRLEETLHGVTLHG